MRASIVWVLWVAGCGCTSDAPSSSTFERACDDSEIDGDCVLYEGAGWLASDVVDNCATGVLRADCPTGSIGQCRIDGETSFSTTTWFYPGFWNVQGAEGACGSTGGIWTPL